MSWYHQRITSTGEFVAPSSRLLISGCAGGGGGAGGDSTPGGGGGGGCAGMACENFVFPAVVGETLTIIIGAAGIGGAVGATGGLGGDTIIVGSLCALKLRATINYAGAGSGTVGGKGGNYYGGSISLPAGGANGVAGSSANQSSTGLAYHLGENQGFSKYTTGAGGGGLNASGGSPLSVNQFYSHSTALGGSNGGGGGGGGHTKFGGGGMGGSNGGAGQNGSGYGSGGGGGSGNSAGGNGAPGFLDIFWSTSAEDGAPMTLTAAYDAAKTAASQSSVDAIPTTPLLAANYTAPDNASVAAIKTKTDNLPAIPAAVGSEMTLIAAYDAAKTAAQADDLADVAADIEAIIERIEDQVPDGPVVVVPAPSAAGKTVAYCVCYDGNGEPEADVVISIRMISSSETGVSYDAAAVTGTSDEDGLVSIELPRGTGNIFEAFRSGSTRRARFSGVDAETLALPAVLGSP